MNYPPKRPFLLVDATDRDRLRRAVQTTHAEVWTTMRAHVDEVRGQPLPVSGSELSMDALRYGVGNRLSTLALVAWVGGHRKDVTLACERLLSLCRWPEWHQRPDIEQSHLLMAATLAHDLLHDDLSPEERRLVEQRLRREARLSAGCQQNRLLVDGRRLYLPRMESPGGWWARLNDRAWRWRWPNSFRQHYNYNHVWINFSALGFAALSLRHGYRPAARWLAFVEDAFRHGIQPLLDGIRDGSWHEGTNYLVYQLSICLPFLDAWRRATGTDFYRNEQLRRAGDYIRATTQPDDLHFVNLGDGMVNIEETMTVPVCRRLAAEYRDRALQEYADRVLRACGGRRLSRSHHGEPMELLGYDAELPAEPGEILAAAAFPDQGVAILRGTFEDGQAVACLRSGVHGGRWAFESARSLGSRRHFNVSHSHADANGVSVFWDGRYVLGEAGDHFYETADHSTLLVDGAGQMGSGTNDPIGMEPGFWQADAALAGGGILGSVPFAVGESARAYPADLGLRRFRRRLILLPQRAVVILDDVELERPRLLTWTFILPQMAEPREQAGWLTTAGPRARVHIPMPLGLSSRREQVDAALRHSRLPSGYEPPTWDPGSDRAWRWQLTTTRAVSGARFLAIVHLGTVPGIDERDFGPDGTRARLGAPPASRARLWCPARPGGPLASKGETVEGGPVLVEYDAAGVPVRVSLFGEASYAQPEWSVVVRAGNCALQGIGERDVLMNGVPVKRPGGSFPIPPSAAVAVERDVSAIRLSTAGEA